MKYGQLFKNENKKELLKALKRDKSNKKLFNIFNTTTKTTNNDDDDDDDDNDNNNNY